MLFSTRPILLGLFAAMLSTSWGCSGEIAVEAGAFSTVAEADLTLMCTGWKADKDFPIWINSAKSWNDGVTDVTPNSTGGMDYVDLSASLASIDVAEKVDGLEHGMALISCDGGCNKSHDVAPDANGNFNFSAVSTAIAAADGDVEAGGVFWMSMDGQTVVDIPLNLYHATDIEAMSVEPCPKDLEMDGDEIDEIESVKKYAKGKDMCWFLADTGGHRWGWYDDKKTANPRTQSVLIFRQAHIATYVNEYLASPSAATALIEPIGRVYVRFLGDHPDDAIAKVNSNDVDAFAVHPGIRKKYGNEGSNQNYMAGAGDLVFVNKSVYGSGGDKVAAPSTTDGLRRDFPQNRLFPTIVYKLGYTTWQNTETSETSPIQFGEDTEDSIADDNYVEPYSRLPLPYLLALHMQQKAGIGAGSTLAAGEVEVCSVDELNEYVGAGTPVNREHSLSCIMEPLADGGILSANTMNDIKAIYSGVNQSGAVQVDDNLAIEDEDSFVFGGEDGTPMNIDTIIESEAYGLFQERLQLAYETKMTARGEEVGDDIGDLLYNLIVTDLTFGDGGYKFFLQTYNDLVEVAIDITNPVGTYTKQTFLTEDLTRFIDSGSSEVGRTTAHDPNISLPQTESLVYVSADIETDILGTALQGESPMSALYLTTDLDDSNTDVRVAVDARLDYDPSEDSQGRAAMYKLTCDSEVKNSDFSGGE